MAHFAQLGENNMVVIIINDTDASEEHGLENENIGISFCDKLLGENTKLDTFCLSK